MASAEHENLKGIEFLVYAYINFYPDFMDPALFE